jgi:Mononegavirales RNA dependent RNA polymerase
MEKTITDELEFCVHGMVAGLRRFVAVPGWVYLRDHRRLLDRNMLLMLKDVLVSRYCSCISVWKDGDVSAQIALQKLVAVYDGGDAIMTVAGNAGFCIIKMLEAHCSLRWTHLAREKRPEIPLSPYFEIHLKQVRKLLQTYATEFHLETFFDCILDEPDPLMVGVYNGTFRHWGHPFIDYKTGLKKLHEQVTMDKVIDATYIKTLASDLSRKVLESEFRKQQKWFVDGDKLPDNHLLKPSATVGLWRLASSHLVTNGTSCRSFHVLRFPIHWTLLNSYLTRATPQPVMNTAASRPKILQNNSKPAPEKNSWPRKIGDRTANRQTNLSGTWQQW